jgi:hypothetical protein
MSRRLDQNRRSAIAGSIRVQIDRARSWKASRRDRGLSSSRQGATSEDEPDETAIDPN